MSNRVLADRRGGDVDALRVELALNLVRIDAVECECDDAALDRADIGDRDAGIVRKRDRNAFACCWTRSQIVSSPSALREPDRLAHAEDVGERPFPVFESPGIGHSS